MITRTDKDLLRHQLASIDWDSSEETEGREVACDMVRISDTLKAHAERIYETSQQLQAGDVEGTAESALSDISADLFEVLTDFEQICDRLF